MATRFAEAVLAGCVLLASAVPAGASSRYVAYVPAVDSDNVTIVDADTHTVIDTIDVSTYCTDPQGVAIGPRGRWAFVGCPTFPGAPAFTGRILRFDLATDRLDTHADLAGFFPRELIFTGDGSRLIARQSNATNTILWLDPATLATTPIGNLFGGRAADGVASSSDGTTLYLTFQAQGEYVRYQDGSPPTLAPFTIGGNPYGLVRRPATGELVVADFGRNAVLEVDPGTGATGVVTAAGGFPRPFRVAVHPTLPVAYSANSGTDNVSFIDLDTNQSTGTAPAGDRPIAIALRPDAAVLYVANDTEGSVTVIDTATRQVLQTIPVGARPFAVGQMVGEREVAALFGDSFED